MRKFLNLIPLALGLILFTTACQWKATVPTAPRESVVKAPIPSLDPEFQRFEFEAEKGGQWQLPSGTQINIPPDAFVDPADSLVKGTVALEYRELHDAYDIYLSGIPMAVGDKHFTTAGSFQLKAQQEGQALSVAECSGLQVRLASFTAGDDYDFFQLDEYSGEWANLGTTKPEVNVERQKQIRKIRRMKPRLRFPLNRRYMAFNYRAILDVYFSRSKATKEAMDEVPEKLKAYGLGWTEAEVHQRINWRGQSYHASLMVWKNEAGKAFPDWTKNRYGKMEDLGNDRYRYHVANKDSSAFFEVKLRAIMPLKALFAFPPEHWVKDYQATMAKVEAEQERLNTMAEVYRTFEVVDMGIYNWDRFLKMDESVLISGDFSFQKQRIDSLAELELIFLSGDGKAVVKFPEEQWSQMALIPDQGGKLFCLLPEQRLAVYTPKQYGAIDFAGMGANKTTAKPFYFEMQHPDRKVESKEDLMNLLAGTP